MKRTAMQHTKMRRLVRALKVPQWGAVGILESLWHLTAREAPQGDLGRLSDEDIADWLGWDADAGELVRGLVVSGWLDESGDATVRLYVHDWQEHADDAIHNQLARAVLCFANGERPSMRRLKAEERLALQAKFDAKYGKGAPVHALRAVASADEDMEVEVERVQAHAERTASALPEPEPEPEPDKKTIPPYPPQVRGGEDAYVLPPGCKFPACHCQTPEEFARCFDPPGVGVRGAGVSAGVAAGVAAGPGQTEDWVGLQVERVMNACGMANARHRKRMLAALELHMGVAEEGAEAAADRMIASWKRYLEAARSCLLRYELGPLKFFVDGHWRSDATWPYRQQGSVSGRKDVGLRV